MKIHGVAGAFEFTLVPVDGTSVEPESGNLKISKGKGSFYVDFTEPGEYTYELSQVDNAIQGVVYDTSKYRIKIYVLSDDEGNLTSTMTVYSVGSDSKVDLGYDNSIVAFENYYYDWNETEETSYETSYETEFGDGSYWEESEKNNGELQSSTGEDTGKEVRTGDATPVRGYLLGLILGFAVFLGSLKYRSRG
jgi:pilin isopeptide linkage protein